MPVPVPDPDAVVDDHRGDGDLGEEQGVPPGDPGPAVGNEELPPGKSD